MIKKTYLVTAFITLMVWVSFAFTTAFEPLYKNLKILPKNITKPQMDSTMRTFARGLGVKCDYCHAKKTEGEGLDFASDKEDAKNEARSMMRMQAKINKKFFDVKNTKGLNPKLEVTCYTCHHGSGKPAKTPPANTDSRPPGAPPAAAAPPKP